MRRDAVALALALAGALLVAIACGKPYAASDGEPPDAEADDGGGDAGDGSEAAACAPLSNLCSAVSAKCGELDDGCGATEKCGTCEAGTSCQSSDAGLACAKGSCVAEPKPTTCNNRCRNVTNNCGAIVLCGGACVNNELCGADGMPSSCSCPTRPSPLNQYYDSMGHFCYTQAAACPGAFQGPIARLYATNPSPGLVKLYRCHKTIASTASAFLLTTQANCENAPGFVLDGSIGMCATTSVCGAVPLYRYAHTSNGDIVHALNATSPPSYVPLGIACYVWPN